MASSSSSMVSRMKNWIRVRQNSNVSESISSVTSLEKSFNGNSNTIRNLQRSSSDLLVAGEIHGRVVLYDVFISHRGSDGKLHAIKIHEDLKSLGIKSFLDVEGIYKGENLSAIIVEAIKSSTVLLVLLTEEFAESPWCLEELRVMVEKIKVQETRVDEEVILLPVFYGVESEDLMNVKSGSFKKAFRMYKKGKEFSPELIKKWEMTLKEVGEFWGLRLSNYKGKEELSKTIVKYVVGRVKNVDLEVAKFPVAVDERVHELTTVVNLNKSVDTPCIVGVFGMTGIGKTTVVKRYYNMNRKSFNFSFFIDDIKTKTQSIGLPNLQKLLLKELALLDLDVRNVSHGIKLLKKHLRGAKFLLVLDGIDDISQLKALLVEEVVSPESVILITLSEDSVYSVLPNASFYFVEKLERHESKELFLKHAMNKSESTYPDLEVFIDRYLDLCDGLPLSLEIIGRSLSGITNKFYWKNNLVKVSEILPEEIKRRFQYYFETLTQDQKDAVFDVACFLEGESVDIVVDFWCACGLSGLDILHELLVKKVVSVVLKDLYIHPQMKQYIFQLHDEAIKNPRQVKRLWRHSDVQRALERRFDFTNVEYLSLVVKESQPSAVLDSSIVPRSQIICREKDGVDLGAWPTEYFAKMSNLKLLILEGQCITKDFIYLPIGIIWLRWRFYPYNFLPLELPTTNLRVLDLSGGKMSDLWTTVYGVPLQLQHLYLQDCSNLKSLPESIVMLLHLEVIDLKGCTSLVVLPNELCFVQSLRCLDLSNCRNLEYLPQHIGELKKLEYLNCSGCWKLQELPDSFGAIASLTFLDLSECWELKTLPLSIGSLTELISLDLSGCPCFNIQSEDHPKTIEAINLLYGISKMHNLETLKLSIKGFTKLPVSYWQLSSLQVLSIQGPNLVELPSLENHPVLTELVLDGCLNLRYLVYPNMRLPTLKTLKISSCGLVKLPDEIGELCNLTTLCLTKCTSLETLPTSFCNLTKLQELELVGNSKLSMTHDSLRNLARLKRLVIDECEISDECLSLAFKSLNCLEDLKLKKLSNYCINISEETLPKLIFLSIDSCENLIEFEISPKLRKLEIMSCDSLKFVIVPRRTEMWLRELILRHCRELSVIKSIPMLKHLEKLDTVGCQNLHYIEGLENVKTLNEMHIFITYWGFTYHGDEWLQELQKNIYAPAMHFATKTVPNADEIFRKFHKMEHHSNDLLMYQFPESIEPCSWIMIAFSSIDTFEDYAETMRHLNQISMERNLNTTHDPLLPRGNITINLFTSTTIETTIHEYPSASSGETIHFSIFTGDSWLLKRLKAIGAIGITGGLFVNLKSGWIRMLTMDEESNIETIQNEFFEDLRKEKEAALRVAADTEKYTFDLLLERKRNAQLRNHDVYRNASEHEKKILLTQKKQEEENRSNELPDPKVSSRSMEDMKSFQALDIANCRIKRVNFLISVAIKSHQLTPQICKEDLFNLPYNESSLSHLQLEIGSKNAVSDATLFCHNTLVQVTVGESYESSNTINHEFINIEASEEERAILANPFGFVKIVFERFQNVENMTRMLEEAQLREGMASHMQFFADEDGVGVNIF